MTAPAVGRPGWAGLAVMLAGSGALHLARPQIYEPLIPRRLGSARAWVLWSGVAEIVCAAGLSAPRTRRAAGLASAMLLVAVFPGNITHAVKALSSSRSSRAVRVGTLVRLPVQAPLVAWALRVAREAEHT